MLKNHQIFLITVLIALVILMTGCSDKSNESENKIAYISINNNSQYQSTFQDLNIGHLSDFNLKLPNANNSWVTIWVEVYSNGKKVESLPSINLSFGLSPNKLDEGNMGLGIIDAPNDKELFFLYAPGVSIAPRETIDVIKNEGTSSWDYAIGSQIEGLHPGETKVLGAYRQNKSSMRTYDFQNEDAINEMINEDDTVLLLKIKVEEKE